MSHGLLRVAALLVLAMIGFARIGAAHADALDDAKAAGLVGERVDGYVGAVTGDPGAEALVDQINIGREARYAEVAAKRGAPVEAVAQIAGRKLIERTPAGQYIMGADGQWQKK